ncbi:unnamed protein product, partial [Tetraodon nigroviridis]
PLAAEALVTTDAAVATPGPSPAATPGSEPPSMPLSPTADGSQRLFFSHDLVSGRYRGSVRFGLVRMIHGEEDFNSDSDIDDGGGGGANGGGGGGGGGGGRVQCGSDTESAVDSPSRPLVRGFVRVQWYPEGGKQDIRETKLNLEDRSVVIRDIVRRNNSSDNQCGIVTNIDIECAVKLVGTNCVLYPVNSRDLQHIWSFMYGDYIAYEFWLGKVYDLTNHIILKLSNGARCSMSVEDGAKLYDICPHVSDSVGSSAASVGPLLPTAWSCASAGVWALPEGRCCVFDAGWGLCSSPQGLFFHEAYGFYPGQVLIGPAKVFSNVQWLSGVKPVLSRKCKFRVVVEEVKVVELKVTWITKSYSPQGSDSVCPPPSSIPQENLCSSLTSSASSSASSQSGGLATNRKKSIPLSIRNLKRKHKKKRTKFSREFKPGDRKVPYVESNPRLFSARSGSLSVAVEVVSTKTTADVMWKDGHLEKNIRSNDLIPIQHIDTHEFCPGDLVVDKRPPALQDPGLYGVIQSGDHKARTCVVKWVKLNSSSDDVEVLGTEEDVSVYDIADHPDFHFRTSDIVIRIWNSEHEQKDCENGTSIGQVSRVDVSSKVEVVWADNSMTVVLPQHLYGVESEMEETDYDSVEETSSVLSTEEWEDESDSWETDNGLTTEDDCHANSADGTATATPNPTPTPTSSTVFIIPLQEGNKAGVTGPSRGGAVNGAEKPSKDGSSRGFRELKEALKILESLKNMTVEQLWTGGSPTSPTSAEPASTTPITTPAAAAPAEKPTKEKRFLDDIKKLQGEPEEDAGQRGYRGGGEDGGCGRGWFTRARKRGGEEKLQPEPQTPVGGADWPSEGLSDTPVLCQRTGGKPGVTFTSAKGEVFSVLEWAPDTHSFKKMEFQPAEAKKFFSTVRKEMALLATSLPEGIMVKTFEDRMVGVLTSGSLVLDLFSALIKGPTRTPYEDGLFLFDIQLPNIYPAVPPLFHYLSQCSGRLNPNLYDNGKVCVSLLGTWIGKVGVVQQHTQGSYCHWPSTILVEQVVEGTERWTSKSSLLQVLISIQGLILVNEPYYNEAGFDSDRGLQEGYENSRCYNEMALIKMVQSMTQLLQNPVEVFRQEIQEHFALNGWRLVHRLEAWLDLNDAAEKASARAAPPRAFPVEDHAGAGPVALAHSSPSRAREEVPGPAVSSILEEELEDSGLGASTAAAVQQELSPSSDGDSSQGHGSLGAELSRAGGPTPPSAARCPATDSLAAVVGSTASQPAVRPKKRRKSYRSFLPEGSGYPDIGFPLFPVSKGFVKSVGSVLQQYRSALAAAGLAED